MQGTVAERKCISHWAKGERGQITHADMDTLVLGGMEHISNEYWTVCVWSFLWPTLINVTADVMQFILTPLGYNKTVAPPTPKIGHKFFPMLFVVLLIQLLVLVLAFALRHRKFGLLNQAQAPPSPKVMPVVDFKLACNLAFAWLAPSYTGTAWICRVEGRDLGRSITKTHMYCPQKWRIGHRGLSRQNDRGCLHWQFPLRHPSELVVRFCMSDSRKQWSTSCQLSRKQQ
jgi:hypothetical protein